MNPTFGSRPRSAVHSPRKARRNILLASRLLATALLLGGSTLLSKAHAEEAFCQEMKGNYECKMARQLSPRYAPLFYRSSASASCMAEPPVTPPYVQAAFPTESVATLFMHGVIACSTANVCNAGTIELRPGADYFSDFTVTAPGYYSTSYTRKITENNQVYSSRSFDWGYTAGNPCDVVHDIGYGMREERPMVCPWNYTRVSATTGVCIRNWMPNMCPIGGPIDPAIGGKLLSETDFDDGGALAFSRRYYSYGYDRPGSGVLDDAKTHVLGRQWQTPYDSRLYFMVDRSLTRAALVNGDGTIKYFRTDGTEYPHYSNTPVESLVDNGNGTWTVTRGDDGKETYSDQGRLLSLWDKTRLLRTLAYDNDGLLQSVTDSRGRMLSFAYAATASAGRIVTVTTPAGDDYHYELDQLENLRSVTMPDGKQRNYGYDNPTYFNAVTSITDENGAPYEAMTYDTQGRATSSWFAPGTHSDTVGRHSFVYSTNKAQVTDPLGLQRDLNYAYDGTVIRLGSTSQPCGSCGSNFQTQTYDTRGYPDVTTDFRGTRTDRDFDARGLETARYENASATTYGCPSGATYYSATYGAACTGGSCWSSQPFAGSSSAAPLGYPTQHYSCPTATIPATRTTQTIWHGSFRQPTERTIKNEQKQVEAISRWEYNARGQVIARCEVDPADSATTCSASTAPPATANVRRWVYAYCEAGDVSAPGSTCPIEGLLKSVNGPRATTDAGMGGLDDITTYTYYPTTDESGCGTPGGACHRKGDLWKVTNALGHVSEKVAYDKNGRLVRSKDANGTITDATYHARGWVLSRTVRANANGSASADDATTAFAYDDAGNVTRVTQPDGAYLNYTYDNAHRLTDVVDNLSNRIHYTLDAAGNRVKEQTYDSSYNPASPSTGLTREMSRVYNQLNRLTKTLNASSAATRDSTAFDTGGLNDGYDGNGNSVQYADGLSVQTKQEYDPLNRLTKTLRDYLATDPETGNATTAYAYDARDNLRTVTDPDALATTYTHDGLSNLTDLDSPDTGHTDYAYDKAGNRVGQTDNRGIASVYTYDALNRLGSVGYPTTSLNVSFYYDESNATTGCTNSYPQGRLTRMVDASGTTAYCYDRRGNATSKAHSFEGTTLEVIYAYDTADRIKAITYADGGIAGYGRDITGRVVSLTWTPAGSSTPVTVVSNATYYPFGPMSVLTYGNGRTLTKTYDANYQIDTIASSATDGLKLDFTTDVMGNIIAASDTIGATTPTRKYVYDHLYRLTRVDDGSDVMQEDYGYNKTGDRTLKQFAGQAAQVYSYLAGTHRLGSIGSTARAYDANGNTTARGDGKTFAYDDRNRLATVTAGSTQYFSIYNGKGERVSKSKQSGLVVEVATSYVYDENGQLLTRRGPNGTGTSVVQYLYVDSTPVAQITDGTLAYLEADHLGTPRVAADRTTNAKQWAWDFLSSAFGEHAPTGSIDVKLRYPGQSFDSETALNYNYFRDYDSSTGRYVQSDPIGLGGGVSTYAYASSSPIEAFDPKGLSWFRKKPKEIRMPRDNPDVQKALKTVENMLTFSCSCEGPNCFPCEYKDQLIKHAATTEFAFSSQNYSGGSEACAWTHLGSSLITITPLGFQGRCRCLASQIFHELLHQVGMDHILPLDQNTDPVYSIERACNPCKAPSLEWDIGY